MSRRTDVSLTDDEAGRAGPRAVLLARQPGLVSRYDKLGAALADGALGGRLRELVRLRVAGIVGCEY